jgi:hypothetical protein
MNPPPGVVSLPLFPARESLRFLPLAASDWNGSCIYSF